MVQLHRYHIYDTVGVYSPSLVVHNPPDWTMSGVATIDATIIAGLTVDLNGPYQGVVNQSIEFSGSASYLPTPANLTYEWAWYSGSTLESTSQVFSKAFSSPGTREIMLRVKAFDQAFLAKASGLIDVVVQSELSDPSVYIEMQDDFNRPNSAILGPGWSETEGNIDLTGNAARSN